MEKYQHMSLIGKGNFGSISKIRRISDGKILVWKELNYGKMDEKEKHHIVSEVNILRELHHPNIVKYHDRIIDKKQAKIYIVMEYCQGGDLSQLIKRCKRNNEYINEDVIWKIFTQIALALHACHNHKNGKVLHRDIKPSNVFLDNDNNVKLGDFGLSRVLSNESNFAYSNVGTPYYMSPEQIDENRYNEKSDIWSLGCCLYELASLRPPFEATNHLSLALKIKAGKIERIPLKYSDELNKVIMWMMNVNQNNRPSVDDIVNLTQVNIRIKERRIKESYAKVRLLEETVRLREVKVIEKEKELERRERCVEERERAVKEKEEMLMKLEGRVRNNNTTNNNNNNNGYFVSESTTLANTNGDSGNNYNYSLKNNSINMKSHLFGYNNETIRTNNSITTNGVNINCTSVDIDNNNNNNIDSHNFKRNDNIQYPNYDIYTSYNNNNNNNQSDNDADSSDMYNSNNNHIYDKYPHHNKRNSFANNKNNLSSPSLPIATPFKEIHSKQPSSHYNSNSNALIHNNYQTNTSSSSNNIPITNYSVSHSTNYTHTNNNNKPLHNYYTNINSSNSSTYNNTRYSHTNTSSTHANKTERHYSHTQHNNTEYKPYFTNNTHSTTNIPNIHIHNTNNNNNSHEHISLPKSTKNASFTKMTIDYGNNTNYANTNINNIISHNSNIINNTTTKTTHIPLPSNSQRNCIETPKRKITQYFHNNNNNNNNNSSNSNQYNHIYTIPRNHSYNNTSQGNFSVNTSYKKKTTFRNNENVPSNNSRRINFETYE